MHRRFRALAPLAGVALALSLAGFALATGTLDQKQENTDDHSAFWNSGYTLAQTFEAGLTGTLDTVSLYLDVQGPQATTPDPGNNLWVSIWNVDDTTGYPDDSSDPLAVENIRGSYTQGWNDIVFTEPPTVTAEASYAIVLNVTYGSHQVNWAGKCGEDLYEMGRALINPSNETSDWQTVVYFHDNNDVADWRCQVDWAFRTYVTTTATESAPPSSAASSAAPSTAASASPSHATITPPPTSGNGANGESRGIGIVVVMIGTMSFCAATLLASRRQLKRK